MDTKIEELEKHLQDLEEKVGVLQQNIPDDKLSMVVFSGDLDRLLAAFIIAIDASAMYEQVMFLPSGEFRPFATRKSMPRRRNC
jgi:hypothetical protein